MNSIDVSAYEKHIGRVFWQLEWFWLIFVVISLLGYVFPVLAGNTERNILVEITIIAITPFLYNYKGVYSNVCWALHILIFLVMYGLLVFAFAGEWNIYVISFVSLVFAAIFYAPLVLLFKTDPSLETTVYRVFGRVDRLRSARPFLFSINLKTARAWKGLTYFGVSIVLLICAILTMAGGVAVAIVVGSPLLIVSRVTYRSAQRYFHHNADYILKKDVREYILFLRSHEEDLLPVVPRLGSLLSLTTTGTLEETLASELKKYGPFVALGNNDHEKPPLGSNRQYFDNQSWKDLVVTHMLNARLIVLVVGLTEGIVWEIYKSIELNVVKKVIIVFPYLDNEIQSQHWDLLSEIFSNTRWGNKFSQVRRNKTLLLIFNDNGEVIEIMSNKNNQLGYEIGIIFSLYCVFDLDGNCSLTKPSSGRAKGARR